jgi:hypothetical protein
MLISACKKICTSSSNLSFIWLFQMAFALGVDGVATSNWQFFMKPVSKDWHMIRLMLDGQHLVTVPESIRLP